MTNFEMNSRQALRNRKIAGLSIIGIIALLHLSNAGKLLNGNLSLFYSGYMSDLLIPFGIYFLLCIAEFNIRFFRKWYVKVAFILGFTTMAEFLQYLNIYALGRTFDPVDILMYFGGVGAAVFVERIIFKSVILNWDYEYT